MINVSNAFRQELFNDNRNYLEYVDITLANGRELNLTNKELWQGGLTIEDSVSGDNVFEVGAAIINKCTVVISNIYEDFSTYDFTGARVVVHVGLELSDGRKERVRKGTYTVDEATYNGDIITLTCLDNMYKFDKSYAESKRIYPASLSAIVLDACSQCGVTLQTYTFPHSNFVVKGRPTDEATTFREVISWAAQIAGCFCRCDTYGRLELKWYDQNALEEIALDGGTFSPWDNGEVVDGGTFSPWSKGTIVSGGTFGDRNSVHSIHSIYSMNISVDDVVITGVKVLEKTKVDEKDAIATYLSGSEGYVVSIENNDLIQDGTGQEIVGWLGEKLIGLRFRRGEISHSSDPTMEAGDVGFLTDRKGNTYRFVMSSTNFSASSPQAMRSSAENPARNSADRYSVETKNYVEYRKNIEKERTDREKALDDLKQRMDESPGLFTTEETLPDGGKIFYMHNKPTLAESDIIWKMTAEAWGVSTDGGKTYNAGMTVDGDMIVRILTAVGINADWIKSGAISIQDRDGNITFFADTESGRVEINANSFSLTGKSINSIAQENIEQFVENVYDPKIAELQKGIDGQIVTWFYDYAPSLNNAPALGWNTESLRAEHEGDMFYWKSKKYAYTFMKEGSTWEWAQMSNPDVAKALEDASKAQGTANSKRRTFVSTPTPPYDIGDLWVQGANGDIMRCQVARGSGSYMASDWVKASKYIDQATADAAAQNAVKAQTQLDIFNKLTNNGAAQGIILEGGKLYVNGEFIQAKGLRVVNSNRQETFYIDNNGNVSIKANSFSLTSGKTIESVAQDEANKAFENISKDSIYEKLTDGGDNKFIIMDEKGDLYINASLIKVGKISGITIESSYTQLTSPTTSYEARIVTEIGRINFYRDDKLIGTVAPTGSYDLDLSTGATSNYQYGISISNSGGGDFVTVGGTIKVEDRNPSGISSSKGRYAFIRGHLSVDESLTVKGTKNRQVLTPDYGERLLYCYEMPSPMFGDIGEAETDSSGECYIYLDDIFSETVTPEIEYQVFLQKEGRGDVWVEEKNPIYFKIKGTENLKFAWEIKAKQKNYECERLEMLESMEKSTDYNYEYSEEIEQLLKERENLLYETA